MQPQGMPAIALPIAPPPPLWLWNALLSRCITCSTGGTDRNCHSLQKNSELEARHTTEQSPLEARSSAARAGDLARPI
jgi:hypothetical protein